MLIALMIQIITQFCFIYIYIYKTSRIDDRFKLVKMKSVKVERGKRGKWRSRIRYRGCQTRFFLFLIHIQRALTRKIQFIKSLLHRRMWSACVINGEKRRAQLVSIIRKIFLDRTVYTILFNSSIRSSRYENIDTRDLYFEKVRGNIRMGDDDS